VFNQARMTLLRWAGRPSHSSVAFSRGMMLYPGQPLDDGGDAVQGPQPPDEPVGGGARQQGLLDPLQLGVGHLGCRADRPSAPQRVDATRPPAGVPDADA
jgi:hypothetical protein